MMGKIPYCGKETRKAGSGFHKWTPDQIAAAQKMDAEGLSDERIGRALGVSRGAVVQALVRARAGRQA